MADWFETLFGVPESAGVHEHLTLQGDRLHGPNGSWGCGTLTTPSLEELRGVPVPSRGPLKLTQVVGNVQELHLQHPGALFQVASQFNLLEMAAPSYTPEMGVTIYAHDRTQGPACAVACAAGTVYRNHFVPVGDGGTLRTSPAPPLGQCTDRQLDMLAGIGTALGNDGQLWRMQNGYCFATPAGLQATTDPTLGRLLRIGLHRDVQVTLAGAGHSVTQVYGSALPIAYNRLPVADWEPFARLVLNASYEATLRAAVAVGAERVFLTLLGGGVFGNPLPWILDAIERACETLADSGLIVTIVSYRSENPEVTARVQRFERQHG